jgi:hypothetical protein
VLPERERERGGGAHRGRGQPWEQLCSNSAVPAGWRLNPTLAQQMVGMFPYIIYSLFHGNCLLALTMHGLHNVPCRQAGKGADLFARLHNALSSRTAVDSSGTALRALQLSMRHPLS